MHFIPAEVRGYIQCPGDGPITFEEYSCNNICQICQQQCLYIYLNYNYNSNILIMCFYTYIFCNCLFTLKSAFDINSRKIDRSSNKTELFCISTAKCLQHGYMLIAGICAYSRAMCLQQRYRLIAGYMLIAALYAYRNEFSNFIIVFLCICLCQQTTVVKCVDRKLLQ